MEKFITKNCNKHGDTKYVLEGRNYYRCIKCRIDNTIRSRVKKKLILVKESGGKCIRCGYNKYVGALQFHHLDKDIKEFAISRANVSIEVLREEIKKCILVCANCHAEIEEEERNSSVV